ncbi:MAG: methylmalonyl-CoA mutase family protein [Chloroherpetonaceae bacterium]
MNIQEELNFDEFPIPSFEDWKNEAIKSLKGDDFEKRLFTKTLDDILLKPIYNLSDLQNNPLYNFQYPGIAPFNRGDNPLGYKNDKWLIAQSIPYPDINQFNTALRNDLENGQNAINIFVAGDKYRPISGKHIRKGLELYTLEDFKQAFDNIEFKNYPLYFSTNDFFYEFSRNFLDFLKYTRIDLKDIKGNLGADVYSQLLLTGNLQYPIEKYYERLAEIFNNYADLSTNYGIININGSLFHNSGANAIQELAYSFTSAIEYLKSLQSLGVEIDNIASRMKFSLGISSNFFTEIAKLRATRILWTMIIRQFDGNNDSQRIFIHSQMSFRNKTKYNPWSNIIRNSTECLAAILGNSNSIDVGFFDFAYGYPSELARRIARNTQLIFQNESHLIDTIDPAAGSYYIDDLTNEICVKTWKAIQNIESTGGFLENIKNGKIQEEIKMSAFNQIQDYHTRKLILVGTNKFPLLNERIPEESIPYEYIENTIDQENKAIEVHPLKKIRFAQDFEKLRDNALNYKEKNGIYPIATLYNFGELADYKPRADFASEYLGIGGFEIQNTPAFQEYADAMKYLLENPCNIIAICSSDENYLKIVPEFAQLVKKFKPLTYIILAGYPKEQIELYKRFGIDDFIYLKSNIYDTLLRIQNINQIF